MIWIGTWYTQWEGLDLESPEQIHEELKAVLTSGRVFGGGQYVGRHAETDGA